MATFQPAQQGITHSEERRRNARVRVVRPRLVSVDIDDQQACAFLIDASEGGFGIQNLALTKSDRRIVRVAFRPKADLSVNASADFVWSNNGKAGLQISEMEQASRTALKQWLTDFVSPEPATGKQPPVAIAKPIIASEVPPPPEEELYSAVARARILSCANGAAIAWAGAEGMTCRSSTGEAPLVGVRVQTEHGLSGECLRTGEVMRCDDTEKDNRLDPEVCRQLHLRSVVIVPIKSGDAVAGLLEVFSSKANAFNDEDVDALIILARECGRPAQVTTAESPEADKMFSPAPMAGFRSISEELPGNGRGKLKMIAPFAVGAALLLGGGIYFASRTSPSSVQKRPPMTQPAPASQQESAVIPAVPSTATPSSRASGREVRSSKPDRAFASEGRSNTTQGNDSVPPGAQASASPRVIQPMSSIAIPDQGVEPPALTTLPNGSNGIALVVGSPSVTVPVLTPGTMISHIAPARLIHKVNPRYPVAARVEHKEGEVVLQITVGANGRVRNIRVVKADPILAPAAIDAVRQWRYEPYKLNGHPIDAEATVRVAFKLENASSH